MNFPFFIKFRYFFVFFMFFFFIRERALCSDNAIWPNKAALDSVKSKISEEKEWKELAEKFFYDPSFIKSEAQKVQKKPHEYLIDLLVIFPSLEALKKNLSKFEVNFQRKDNHLNDSCSQNEKLSIEELPTNLMEHGEFNNLPAICDEDGIQFIKKFSQESFDNMIDPSSTLYLNQDLQKKIKSKMENLKSACNEDFSGGHHCTTFTNKEFPGLIFLELRSENAKERYEKAILARQFALKENLTTLRIPRPFLLELNDNRAILVQDKIDVLSILNDEKIDKTNNFYQCIRKALRKFPDNHPFVKNMMKLMDQSIDFCLELGFWDLGAHNGPLFHQDQTRAGFVDFEKLNQRKTESYRLNMMDIYVRLAHIFPDHRFVDKMLARVESDMFGEFEDKENFEKEIELEKARMLAAIEKEDLATFKDQGLSDEEIINKMLGSQNQDQRKNALNLMSIKKSGVNIFTLQDAMTLGKLDPLVARNLVDLSIKFSVGPQYYKHLSPYNRKLFFINLLNMESLDPDLLSSFVKSHYLDFEQMRDLGFYFNNPNNGLKNNLPKKEQFLKLVEGGYKKEHIEKIFNYFKNLSDDELNQFVVLRNFVVPQLDSWSIKNGEGIRKFFAQFNEEMIAKIKNDMPSEFEEKKVFEEQRDLGNDISAFKGSGLSDNEIIDKILVNQDQRENALTVISIKEKSGVGLFTLQDAITIGKLDSLVAKELIDIFKRFSYFQDSSLDKRDHYFQLLLEMKSLDPELLLTLGKGRIDYPTDPIKFEDIIALGEYFNDPRNDLKNNLPKKRQFLKLAEGGYKKEHIEKIFKHWKNLSEKELDEFFILRRDVVEELDSLSKMSDPERRRFFDRYYKR